MSADDICIANKTVGRLQNQLNVLCTSCKRYGLGVNLSKTKLVNFRNGGPLRCNERFYLNGQNWNMSIITNISGLYLPLDYVGLYHFKLYPRMLKRLYLHLNAS